MRTVGLQGSLVIILFVDHKNTRVLHGTVEDIRLVARLLAHFWDRNAHDALKLLLLPSLHGQLCNESEHPALLATIIKVCNSEPGAPLDGERVIHADCLGSEDVDGSIGRGGNP